MEPEERYKETHDTWNSIARPYEELFMELPIYDHTYTAYCELLSHGKASVLELGCGPGNITRRLLDRCPELDILATDVSQNMIDLAGKNNPTIRTQLLDCRDLHVIDKQFDGIVCGFTIPYLSDADVATLIESCGKLLLPKGVLYLSFVPGPYDRSGFISGSSGQRTYFYYHDREMITQQLRQNGLDNINEVAIDYKKANDTSETHMIIIARRRAITR